MDSIANAAPLVIVEDGQPRATIVVATNETKATTAATEIQKYVEKMSGAKLPVVTEGAPVSTPVSILVGHTVAAQKLGVKIPAGFDATIHAGAFDEEGYVLKTAGNAIVVAGNSDGPYYGTVFAAYALLEQLGCRFYFPGAWGEIVPQQKTISVAALDVAKRPDFAVRNIWLSGWVPITKEERATYAEWTGKIGFSRGESYPVAGDGFLGGLLPAAEYWETHPEYFAMNKQGDRKPSLHGPKKSFYPRITMLCLSNPDVLTESIKNLEAAFAGQRKMDIVRQNGFGISPPDGAPFCYCEKCLAGSQNFTYPTYVHERMQSEEFFGFAAKLALEFPDKWVGTMAYALREMPPQGVKLPANVAVVYAPISCCVQHANNDPSCWRRQEFVKILRQWRAQTPHLTIYDYNPGFLSGMFLPERDIATFTINAPIYKEIGIKGFNAEGRKAFMQTWLSYYIRAKLLWDAKADVPAIKKEFYTLFFGAEAGPHIQAWWDACEEALGKDAMHSHEDFLINHIYTVAFTKKIHSHIEAARQAKLTDEQRGRVEAVALIADHLEAYAEMNEAEKNLDYTKAAAAAARMTADKQKLNEIYSFFMSLEKRAVPRSYFAEGRQLKFEQLATMTGGTTGTLVAPLPMEMRFVRDRFNEGVVANWYTPAFDDSQWARKNTFVTWDQQDPPEDSAGHDYDGYGWYRGEFDIPAKFAGKPVRFWSGGVINEGWVWINGEYAGHKPHAIWWLHPHDFELDVTKLLKPGRNTIAVRVWNNSEIGGLYRRGFFWTPNTEPVK